MMAVAKLPPAALGPTQLKNTLKFYALVDAILCPEWEYRYYSFDDNWDSNEQMGSMRNGQGDGFFAHFTAAGCLIKGFDHECAMSPWSRSDSAVWPDMFSAVPTDFNSSLSEPAFDMDNTTFCIWRLNSESTWHQSSLAYPEGQDPDGAEHLLGNISPGVDQYCEFAADYFEVQVDPTQVERIHSGAPLSDSILATLNAEVTKVSLDADLKSIGWQSYVPVDL